MKTVKLIVALGLGVLVSACANLPDVTSRNAPFEATEPLLAASPLVSESVPQTQLPYSMNVTEINVRVPRHLSVSEANVYYPRADIVWRGEPIGDRHSQIEAIFRSAFAHGTQEMKGEVPVVLDVEVTRFHSVSEKTRYTTGGVHNMEFTLTVRSAESGLALAPPRAVEANLNAFGGRAAIAADRAGQTQKVRVTGYLSQVIRQELAKPQVQRIETGGVTRAATTF